MKEDDIIIYTNLKEATMRMRRQKKGSRMIFLCLILAIGFGLSSGPIPAQGQEAKFPSKPVEMVVPFAPGGIVDIAGRIYAEPLTRELKVPVVIKNLAGAGGLTGTTAFLNTRPDGYTILLAPGAAFVSGIQLSKSPPFDLRKDILPLGYVADAPIAMAIPKASPFKSFNEFAQFGKSHPGQLKGGFASVGAEAHLMLMAFIRDAKIECKVIPYLSAGALNMAMLGGHLDVKSSTLPSTWQYISSGDMRVLVLTRRSPLLPDVPAGPEIGLPSVSVNLWLGFFSHPKTPKAVYDRLVSAVERVSKDPEITKKLTDIGCTVEYKNPRETSKLIENQWDIIGGVIKETGLKVN